MNKRPLNILAGVGAGVGIGSALLLTYKPNRDRLKGIASKVIESISTSNRNVERFPIKQVGHPHPENVEDNTMVSEGAMYSVNYYNKSQQA